MLPNEFEKLSWGEKKVVRYFMYQELEDKSNENKAMNEG